MRRFARIVYFLAIAVWTLALLLRVTIADRVPLLSTLFYATPPAVLAVLALVLALSGTIHRTWRLAMILIIAAIGCSAWHWQSCMVHNETVAESDGLRVLFWNVQGGKHGLVSLVETIRSYDADIVGLVEAGDYPTMEASDWQRELPEYQTSTLGGQMLLLTKAPQHQVRSARLANLGRCRHFEVGLDTGALTCVLVDIRSNPLLSRRASLAALADEMRPLLDNPTLVMGDFNTPLESAHFGPLRTDWQHAFLTAGAGYHPTWPLPVPVLTLDHIWASPSVKLLHCEAGWTSMSDHRPVLVEVEATSLINRGS